MKHRRRFGIELKRQAVEELLSGVRTPAQLIRRYEISSGLLYLIFRISIAREPRSADPGHVEC
jgi:transposase-like protein